MSQYSLSVLCHFVALADCIRSGYVGGQLVITRNILSFFFSQLFNWLPIRVTYLLLLLALCVPYRLPLIYSLMHNLPRGSRKKTIGLWATP